MREEHSQHETARRHLEIARKVWEAVANGDADRIAECYAPDAVIRGYGNEGPLVGEFKGIAEILDRLARVGEGVDDLRSEVLEIYGGETGAVIRYRSNATRGGKQIDMPYVYVLTIEQDRITHAMLIPSDQRRHDEFWRAQ